MKKRKKLYKKFALAIALFLIFLQTQICLAGKKEENQAQTDKTKQEESAIYGIGSISKMFPTVAIMQLVEQKKLDLDTPVVQYLPEFEMKDKRYKKITPRMLLDHSSGLMGTSDYNAMLLGECDSTAHDEFLERLKKQRLKADPGEFSVYSNDGFTLAEILVEKVSGISFTEYIDKYISKKLEMTDTYTPASDFDRKRQAKGYYNQKNMELPNEYLYEIGAGGILSTAEDLCKFGQIFTEKGTKVLSTKSVEEIASPQTNHSYFQTDEIGKITYGLGWDCVFSFPFQEEGIKAVTKGGDTKVYHGNLTVLPEENLVAAVLSSGGTSTLDQLMVNDMLKGVLKQRGQEVKTEDLLFPELKKDADLSQWSHYEGYYIAQGLLKVRFQNGALYISTLDQKRNVTQEYLPAEGNVFVSTNGDYISSSGELLSTEGGLRGKTILSFQEGSNQEIYLCVNGSEVYSGLGQMITASPLAQKVENLVLSKEIESAWKERDGVKYYLIDEKATSSSYLEAETTMRMSKEGEGYFRNAKIIDKNWAQAFVKIPMMMGRDLIDYHFYTEDGKEYMEMKNGGKEKECLKKRYLSEKSIKILSDRECSIRLEEKERTRWYQIGEKLSGELIKIEVPVNGAYFIYDTNDRLTASSILINEKEGARLPDGGKIAFVGKEGDIFEVQ